LLPTQTFPKLLSFIFSILTHIAACFGFDFLINTGIPKSRRIHTGFLVPRATWDTAEVQTISLTGLSPSLVCLPRHLQLSLSHLVCCPATPTVLSYNWFGLFPFHSPLLRESLFCFIFLSVLRCFSSRAYLHITYLFSYGLPDITLAGLPHSET
jgi:hypothetical protein